MIKVRFDLEVPEGTTLMDISDIIRENIEYRLESGHRSVTHLTRDGEYSIYLDRGDEYGTLTVQLDK